MCVLKDYLLTYLFSFVTTETSGICENLSLFEYTAHLTLMILPG